MNYFFKKFSIFLARHGSGKGPYSSRDSKPKLDKASLQPVHAEGLSVESLLAKEDKMIVYQLAPDKPTTHIEEWFKGNIFFNFSNLRLEFEYF